MSAAVVEKAIERLIEAAFEKGRRVGVQAPYKERGWAQRDLDEAKRNLLEMLVRQSATTTQTQEKK